MTDINPTIACPSCDAHNSPADKGQDLKSALCAACGSPMFPGHPFHMTAQRFNAHALAGFPTLIDFWADWCGPCKSMAPVFEQLAAEFEPMVRFAKVDTDAEKELAEYFRIQTIPTLSLIRNQREVARISGTMPAGQLRRWLYSALSDTAA